MKHVMDNCSAQYAAKHISILHLMKVIKTVECFYVKAMTQ